MFTVLRIRRQFRLLRTSKEVGILSENNRYRQVLSSSTDIQYATWSPVNYTIAYVRGNNLYVWQDGLTTQITKDGGPDVFNAIPDWVYEEEIFGDRSTLWFSPDGEELAFLRFDETGVR